MNIPCSCGERAQLVTGKIVYPHRPDLKNKHFYLCECGNYVGCHPKTKMPLGTPADFELRQLRMKCHTAIDSLWSDGKQRKVIYEQVAFILGIDEFHIGESDKEECTLVIKFYNQGVIK